MDECEMCGGTGRIAATGRDGVTNEVSSVSQVCTACTGPSLKLNEEDWEHA